MLIIIAWYKFHCFYLIHIIKINSCGIAIIITIIIMQQLLYLIHDIIASLSSSTSESMLILFIFCLLNRLHLKFIFYAIWYSFILTIIQFYSRNKTHFFICCCIYFKWIHFVYPRVLVYYTTRSVILVYNKVNVIIILIFFLLVS